MFLRPVIFQKFSELVAVQTTRYGGVSSEPFDSLNLSKSTEDIDKNVDENIRRVHRVLGIKKIARCKQVHGNNIEIVKEAGLYSDTDGLISTSPGLFVSILVADCTPVLLYDKKNKIIAAIHAGWRGAKKQIVRKAIQKMRYELNSDPENIFAFIGACISSLAYEVGEEVALNFEEKFLRKHRSDDRKYFLDLKQVNNFQLQEEGVLSKNIEISEFCTVKNNKMFFSHRKSKHGKTGRMMSLIGYFEGKVND